MTALILLIVGCALLGFVTGRWWSVAGALTVIPVYYLGLAYGWWGSGLGDGAVVAAIFFTALCAAVTAASVAAGRARLD